MIIFTGLFIRAKTFNSFFAIISIVTALCVDIISSYRFFVHNYFFILK